MMLKLVWYNFCQSVKGTSVCRGCVDYKVRVAHALQTACVFVFIRSEMEVVHHHLCWEVSVVVLVQRHWHHLEISSGFASNQIIKLVELASRCYINKQVSKIKGTAIFFFLVRKTHQSLFEGKRHINEKNLKKKFPYKCWNYEAKGVFVKLHS